MRLFNSVSVLALAVCAGVAAPSLAQNLQTQNTQTQNLQSMPSAQPGMTQPMPTQDMQTPGMQTQDMQTQTMQTPGMQASPANQPGMIAEQAVPATTGVDTMGAAKSPDGSQAFGFEPYFGVLGGYNSFDRTRNATGLANPRFDGALVEGILGFNIPLGPVFFGVEGHGAKGFGDLDWEYGVRGRAGARIGDSGLIYGSVGYTWIEARDNRGFVDMKDWVYGLGVEVGPRDIGLGGISGSSGARLRFSVETMDFNSIRPMAGVVFHF